MDRRCDPNRGNRRALRRVTLFEPIERLLAGQQAVRRAWRTHQAAPVSVLLQTLQMLRRTRIQSRIPS